VLEPGVRIPEYLTEVLDAKWDEQGLERSKSIPIKGFIFDDLQTAFAAEHLPWSAEFECIIPEFSSKDLAVRKLRMSMTERETVTVVDCCERITQSLKFNCTTICCMARL